MAYEGFGSRLGRVMINKNNVQQLISVLVLH